MGSRCCLCVCLCLCIPLSFLGNGSVKVPLSLLGNGSVNVPLSLLGNGSVKIPTVSSVYYEITLLSVCVHIVVSFSVRSVPYKRKVCDQFFQNFLYYIDS
jgi:hypothetical protein